jgi:2-polyprenyl-6-methoxyphenol hydroxylase-like FAD-dependent oxidoreductase
VARLVPWLADRVATLDDWKKTHMLAVAADRLPRWHTPGLLFIGDAAHAMSPVMGVGINYAIQDAVALANATARSLRTGRVPTDILAAVQRRRERPVRRMQRIQRLAHARIARPAHGKPAIPRGGLALLRLFQPIVRRAAARLVGRGFLPEHVGPDVLGTS